jgi:hypothetical protein
MAGFDRHQAAHLAVAVDASSSLRLDECANLFASALALQKIRWLGDELVIERDEFERGPEGT